MGACNSHKDKPRNGNNHTLATVPTGLMYSESMPVPRIIRNQISNKTEYDGIIVK
jgi:hypothetical protein